jgi:uncharacterized protein
VIPELLWAFVIGLAGSLHCLGMCGPLVMAYSLHLRPEGSGGMPAAAGLWRTGLVHHVAFHSGRLATYGFLGALAAGSVHLAGIIGTLPGLRIIATLGGGLLMIFLGLVLLRAIPMSFASLSGSPPKKTMVGRLTGTLLRSGGLASRCVLGCTVGFLPCMLSWAMIIKAALTGNPAAGFLYMILFGLGTVPVLLFTGFSASLLSLKVRLAGERMAALSVIVMGLILVLKGVVRLV